MNSTDTGSLLIRLGMGVVTACAVLALLFAAISSFKYFVGLFAPASEAPSEVILPDVLPSAPRRA